MRRYFFSFFVVVLISLSTLAGALAAPSSSPDASAEPSPANAPGAYQKFINGLINQPGLFTLWRKDGKVFMELAKNQLDADFLETSTPATGMGGLGVTP